MCQEIQLYNGFLSKFLITSAALLSPSFGGSHVGKGYIILFLKIENINLRVLNDDFRHYVIDALSFSHKGSTIHKIIFFSMNYLQNIEYGNTASNEGIL